MRRTPLARRTPLRSYCELTRTRIRPRSAKRAAQMRRYRPLAAAYLEGHPICEFPLGCDAAATEVHHKRGREGDRLLDVDWFAAACRVHNDYAETRTGHALAIGWLVRIEGAA